MKATPMTMKKLVLILVSFAASAVCAASLNASPLGCNGGKKEAETKKDTEAKQSKEESSDVDPSFKEFTEKYYHGPARKRSRRRKILEKSEKARQQVEYEKEIKESFLEDFEKDHSRFHIYSLDSFLGVNFDDPPMKGAVAEHKLPIDDTLLYRFTPKKPFLGFEKFYVAYDHLGEICFISAAKDCSQMSKASAEECLVDISKMFKKKYGAKPRYHFEGESAQSFSLHFMDFCKENFRDVTVSLHWEEGLKLLQVYAGDKLKLGAKTMMDRASKSPEAAIDAL